MSTWLLLCALILRKNQVTRAVQLRIILYHSTEHQELWAWVAAGLYYPRRPPSHAEGHRRVGGASLCLK